ncbi:MAG: type II toxin-antitoxin system VapC family toxin [Cyclobacteriaceae bacterium]
MNVLIDTHILLWWLDVPAKLSSQARLCIEDIKNNVFVSSAVIWEITIKKSIGKLQVPDGLLDILKEEGFISLPITGQHVMGLEQLPNHHVDPFDRIQIAQALIEGITFITRDKRILEYDVPCVKG